MEFVRYSIPPVRQYAHADAVSRPRRCGLFHNYDAETKCQGIVPLEEIVGALSNRELPMCLRLVVMRSLREIWLDTQRPATGLIGHDGLIDALTVECGRVGEYLAVGRGDEPAAMLARSYVFVELLPAVWYLYQVWGRWRMHGCGVRACCCNLPLPFSVILCLCL